jgi:predicted NBD/HSP70 family sugar kinase
MRRKRSKIAGYVKRRINLRQIGPSSRRLLCLLDDRRTMSQSEAARALGLSVGTCNLHFQHLEHEGLVCRVKTVREARGRPTVVWGVDTAANHCVSAVFDVPYMHASLVTFAGDVLSETRTDLSRAKSQDEVRKLLDAFLRESKQIVKGRRGWIRQVFVAVPGLLDPATGAVMSAVNFPVLDGLDPTKHVAKAHGLACYTGSLGPPFYYGESERLAKGTTAMVVHWDLGLGVVFGHGGRVLSIGDDPEDGRQGIAEIGHIGIAADGPKCHCGRRGCLEAYTGGWAMLEELGLGTLEELVSAVTSSDAKALAVAQRAAERLGEQLVWPLSLMRTDRVIVTGPLASVFGRVREAFERGLSHALSAEEIRRLAPEASPDPAALLRRGTFLLAKRLFFHPEDAVHLPQAPKSLGR